MKRGILCIAMFAITIGGCFSQNKPTKPSQWVNPFIGTQGMGHTFPGATVPFGSVQLSPDTDTIPYATDGAYNKKVYEYCSGYQYNDKTIVGFSHTHFSGTGHSDLGDILVMPTTGKLRLNPGTASNPDAGYRSRYSHSNETAEPNYYQVFLNDYSINAELTTTTRVGMHRYTFPKSEESQIIIDLTHGIYNYPEKNVWTFIRVENDTLVTGYRQTHGWARTRTVYFAIAFSKPFKTFGLVNNEKLVYNGFWRKFDQSNNFPENAGRNIKSHFDFETTENEQILIKVAISPVNTSGAINNLIAEVPHWDFEKVKKQGQEIWNKELSKIEIETLNEGHKINFYTSLYHAFMAPTVYMDTDGSYKGLDQNTHTAEGFVNHTTFSLWDTYRALHPLFNIIQPSRNVDMIKSMLAHYSQSVHKMLPVWSHYANENWCMIGYHSVSLLADAIAKSNSNFDTQFALEAAVQTANNGWYDGLEHYIKLGYVPEDKSGNSVSKTLEYAYDDWAIAQMAKKLNNTKVYEVFKGRSQSYQNVFDTTTHFARPKLSNGTFREDFDPLDTHNQGFIEGNSWNYSLYVPHDEGGLKKVLGGQKGLETFLDSVFSMTLPDRYFENTEDITREGIIGNYVHGNEPSHHIPYLYNWTANPWKGQRNLRMICEAKYKPTPDGLSGNDDLGQMSAWYIFSALGFYPVAPGSEYYQLGSPVVVSAKIHLENGKTFRVKTVNQSPTNFFVQKVTLNGKDIAGFKISHSDIMAGGELTFYLGSLKK